MSLQRELIEDIVRDVLVGSGDVYMNWDDLQNRVEERTGVTLTQQQVWIVQKAQHRCIMETEMP